ncbi:MAG: hypothetical protein J6W70_04615, partial [Lentisphaeria bacterium]|nr:hypothetical protein [Lentisphaeria bacterium]
MLQFVPKKIVIPPSIAAGGNKTARPVSLDPRKMHLFASTHIDVGGCPYYRILFISQLISQKYINTSFCDARLLFNYTRVFPQLASFRLQRACGLRDIPWFQNTILPAKQRFGFPV